MRLSESGPLRLGAIASLALSAPAAWALPRILGLPAADPLAGTVAVVPPIVAGLFAVEAAARRHGARAPRPGVRAVQGVALLAWLLLAAARARLVLPLAPALAAGLFALLGLHLLELLPRLRPLLGTRVPERPSATFFWLPLLVYLAILPWSAAQRPPDGDEPYYLLVTHSLAYDGDGDLTNNYAAGDSLRFVPRRLSPQPGDPVGQHGELYSRHNLLLPLLLAGPYRLAGPLGAFATMAILAAALAWLTLRLARHRFAAWPGGVLLVWALLAFAPPLLLYSHQVWVEVPAALLIALALDALPQLGTRRRSLVVFWAAVALLPLLKLRFAAFAALLTALAWWRGGRRVRGLALAGAGLAALFAGILVFNQARFGAALKIYALEQLLPESGLRVVFARVLGLFFDVGFGLFAVAPLWVLLLPALGRFVRRSPRAALELGFVVLPYLVLVAFRREWFGGWSPPFRYGLAVLPLLALPLAPLLGERRGGGARLLLAALSVATGGLTLLWLAVPGWTYNLADGGTHLLAHLGEQLRLDVARLLPSAIRLRPATWWWPPLVLLLTLVFWRLPRKRLPVLVPLGVALALVAPAAALVAASRLPTRLIELEDRQVAKQGGGLYPPLWTFDRGRFRGGWTMMAPSRAEAPMVAGGDHLRLSLWYHVEPGQPEVAQIVLLAGAQPLVRRELGAGHGWRRIGIGPVVWPPGAPLVLEVPAGGASVLVDRVELDWR